MDYTSRYSKVFLFRAFLKDVRVPPKKNNKQIMPHKVAESSIPSPNSVSESLKLSYLSLKSSGTLNLNFRNFEKYYRNRRNWSLGILRILLELSNLNELSLKLVVILIVIGKDELQLLVCPSKYYWNIIGMVELQK